MIEGKFVVRRRGSGSLRYWAVVYAPLNRFISRWASKQVAEVDCAKRNVELADREITDETEGK